MLNSPGSSNVSPSVAIITIVGTFDLRPELEDKIKSSATACMASPVAVEAAKYVVAFTKLMSSSAVAASSKSATKTGVVENVMTATLKQSLSQDA